MASKAILEPRQSAIPVQQDPDVLAAAARMAGEDLPAGRLTGSDLVWLVDADALGDLTPDAVA